MIDETLISRYPVLGRIDGVLQRFMGDAPEPARLLGAAGLIPFVVLALASLFVGGWVDTALLIWAAVVLSGVGMVRFGFACAGMGQGATWSNLSTAVAPTIYAWVVTMVLAPASMTFGMLLMIVGFGGMLYLDRALTRREGAPAWWFGYRLALSIGVMACLAVGMF